MIRSAFFFALLLFSTLAFVWLLRGFFKPIFWAAALAVTFYPVERHINATLKGRGTLAAIFTVMLILITVIVPALFVAGAVVREATALYVEIQGERAPATRQLGTEPPLPAPGEPPDPDAVPQEVSTDGEQPLNWLARTLESLEGMRPMVDGVLAKVGSSVAEIQAQLSDAIVTASRAVAGQALSVGQNALRFGIEFFLMLYLLFFFLRDGDKILDLIVRVLPIGDERERALMAKFAGVSRATIKGTLIVGMLQGAMGGVLFALLGIKGAFLWGVVMAILSILPVVGASLVWLPVAIWMIADGELTKGIVVIAFGAIVIGLADNILRPLLVGRDTKMPDYLVLLSTLGGLSIFGISGFVIGPVIAALFLSTWAMFESEFRGGL